MPDTAYLGEKYTIKCVSEGVPEPTYTIIHNGSRKVSNENTFTLCQVNWTDIGKYECIASNKLGNNSISGDLIVKGKIVYNV